MTKTIGILGCGLVGSYVGLHLQNLPEIKVYFIGRRDSWREELRSSTLTTSSCSAASAPTSVQGSKLNIVLSLDEIEENMAGLPNFIFVLLMPLFVKVDEKATSSMFEDLKNKRDTEIEYLQGEVCRLAEKSGVKVPCNAAVRELIHKRQSLKEGVISMRPSEIYSTH